MLIHFGPELSFLQRIGYAAISLMLLAIGLISFRVVVESWMSRDLLTGLLWLFPATVILSVGANGLVNVLRFPKANT